MPSPRLDFLLEIDPTIWGSTPQPAISEPNTNNANMWTIPPGHGPAGNALDENIGRVRELLEPGFGRILSGQDKDRQGELSSMECP